MKAFEEFLQNRNMLNLDELEENRLHSDKMIDKISELHEKNQSLKQERQYISRISCSQLMSEAIDYEKAGDYLAAQGYISQAQGYYNSGQRRADAYLRNCR